MSYNLLTQSGNKPFLNINANSINVEQKIDSFELFATTIESDNILLVDNPAVVPPPNDVTQINSDGSRLIVSNQSFANQSIAYLSDIASIPTNRIQADDLSNSVQCQDGSVAFIEVDTKQRLTIDSTRAILKDSNNIDRLIVEDGGYTSLRSNTGVSTRLDLDSNGSVYIATNDVPTLYISSVDTRIWSPDGSVVLKLDGTGITANNYLLPLGIGASGQVMTSNGAGLATWSALPVAVPSWVNSYYDPAIGTSTNVPLGGINAFSEVTTVLTLQQTGALFDTPSNGRLRYVGVQPITVSVNYSISMDSSANNSNVLTRLYRSGVPLSGSTSWVFNGNGINVSCSSVSFTVTLTSGQYLSLFIANNSSAGTSSNVNSANISLNIL
jgi:hypothetical protein